MSLYSSIEIRGYRGLREFALRGLGRVNLLVGTNNCGKTSVLECIELLNSAEKNTYLYSSILGRRGEWIERREPGFRNSIDIRHLFSERDLGREIRVDALTAADADHASQHRSICIGVQPSKRNYSQPTFFDENEDEDEDGESFGLVTEWTNPDARLALAMSSEGIVGVPRRPIRMREENSHGVQFIRTNGMNAQDTVRLFDDIVLTEREEDVTEALRIIEPTIERIASVSVDWAPAISDGPSGIFLRTKDAKQRVPIGSAGDGMWRILGLALALANAKGGVLLVDEIDTGLHYSVMEDMWRMISERATALNAQVFATTHSRDCYESLAAIATPESSHVGVTIQRIDRKKGRAVRFSNEEIVAAAERGIEVR